MISRPLYCHEFVGRRDELGFLAEEFRAASQARLRLAIIDGEAGIGKTRLLNEFLASLDGSATVAVGHCGEPVRSPYLPFSEIVQRLDPRARLAALRPRDPNLRRSEEKWAYFWAVADVIRAEAARRPVVVAIEDAQWADDASIDLLRFLLAQLASARCMILATLRREAAAPSSAETALRMAALRMRAATVQLRALNRHEIKRVVQEALAECGAHLAPAILAQIETLAEGNPLFAEELASIALASGALSFQGQVPLTAQTILQERLSRFTASERGVLSRAAVIGEAFEAGLLAAIAEHPLEDVVSVLERAVEAGLMHEDERGIFSFRHALIRQVLADQLVLALAAPLHMRIAAQLESASDAGDRCAQLAYHWSAARVAAKARQWNERAGEIATSVYAYRDAIRFYTESVRWHEARSTHRARLYERLGTLLYVEGCGEEPAHWFALARSEYEACSNDVGAAHAMLLLADQFWIDGRTQESVKMASAAADRLSALGHKQMYAEALLSVARYAVTLGDLDRAQAYLREAQPLQQSFDTGSRASRHEVQGEIEAVLGNAPRSRAQFRFAAQLAAQSGVSELISQIENNYALAAFDLGDLDLASARHQIAVDEAHRTGMMWRIAYSSLNYARTLTFKGDLQRARTLAWEAVETGVTTATFKTKVASVGIPLALLLNDRALLDACSHESALQVARQSGEIQRIASVFAAFAALRAAQGSLDETRALLREAVRNIAHAHRAWDLLIAIAQWGDPADVAFARALLEMAVGRPIVKRAYVLLFEAFAASRGGERTIRLARLSAANFRRMGNELYAAYALEAAGEPSPGLLGGRTMRRDPMPLEELRLTPRQRQIAELVAQGETNRGIAQHLNISENTVEHHLKGIFERLGLHSRAQVAHMLGTLEQK
ncbi:MAG TPA: AAA family ATPase [Candidatus Baltobacteraceae bacterium]|nr:AAA family ATPase [Candidatus Baltobacteraceae bacterium]